MNVRRLARVLYSEGNTDGTVGGSYYSLLFLLQNLDRTRVDPLLVLRADTPLLDRFRKAVGDVRIFPRRPAFTFGDRAGPALRWALRPVQRACNVARFYLAVVGLARFIRRERIDLVHLNNSVTSNHDWMLASMLARVPCVTHERGLNERYSPMARWCAPRLAAILCISQAVYDKLVEHDVSHTNLVLVHNGLDPQTLFATATPEDVRKEFGIGLDRRIIGMVGNIREWKGQEIVVRALPLVRDLFPEVTCLFVGEATDADSAYVQRLRTLISDSGLENTVVFSGYCPNVANPLSVMEVAIHASVAPEPFGRVLLEAMAMRKPIVGSAGGAVTEIVVNGSTGLTFPPGDERALAEGVCRLLGDPAGAQRLGEAGYRRLVSDFGIEANVARTLAAYDRVLGMTHQ